MGTSYFPLENMSFSFELLLKTESVGTALGSIGHSTVVYKNLTFFRGHSLELF